MGDFLRSLLRWLCYTVIALSLALLGIEVVDYVACPGSVVLLRPPPTRIHKTALNVVASSSAELASDACKRVLAAIPDTSVSVCPRPGASGRVLQCASGIECGLRLASARSVVSKKRSFELKDNAFLRNHLRSATVQRVDLPTLLPGL